MAAYVERTLSKAPPSQIPDHTEPKGQSSRARASRSVALAPLPFHLGATEHDFRMAKWLVQELGKRPYYDQAPTGRHHGEARIARLRRKAERRQKLRQRDEFLDLVHSVFDPVRLSGSIKG
jgi:hypothetical protein